jgi:hypothetical protein
MQVIKKGGHLINLIKQSTFILVIWFGKNELALADGCAVCPRFKRFILV